MAMDRDRGWGGGGAGQHVRVQHDGGIGGEGGGVQGEGAAAHEQHCVAGGV